MASLREIKDRIGSVRSTLKITSAMKLVASAKLRKAQKAIEGMRPYENALTDILVAVQYGGISPEPPAALKSLSDFVTPAHAAGAPHGKTAIVAVSSNSSLCGGFNANVVRKALETIRSCGGEVEVFPVGRKMTEALRRAGYTADRDLNDLIGHPSYEKSATLARELARRFEEGEFSRVVLVYNHFVSTSSQVPVEEQFLPLANGSGAAKSASADDRPAPGVLPEDKYAEGGMLPYSLEPDAQALAAQLLPQVQMLKFHAAILDSAAAEQAARTIAMQTATDNAEDLLGELTLEYNKGRQQKITAEILDLLGGAAE